MEEKKIRIKVFEVVGDSYNCYECGRDSSFLQGATEWIEVTSAEYTNLNKAINTVNSRYGSSNYSINKEGLFVLVRDVGKIGIEGIYKSAEGFIKAQEERKKKKDNDFKKAAAKKEKEKRLREKAREDKAMAKLKKDLEKRGMKLVKK